MTLKTSASPAGLTARARPQARPDRRAANLRNSHENCGASSHTLRGMDTQTMTPGAAVIGVVVALMAGFYLARLDRFERANRAAKATAGAAGRQVWRGRWTILLIGFVVFLVVNLWFRGRGR